MKQRAFSKPHVPGTRYQQLKGQKSKTTFKTHLLTDPHRKETMRCARAPGWRLERSDYKLNMRTETPHWLLFRPRRRLHRRVTSGAV